MPSLTTHANRKISATHVLGKGGEGIVYEVSGHSDLVAKVYHPQFRNVDRERKLKAMVANPPQDEARKMSPPHISIAWPTDVVYEQGRFAGFLMPRITQSPDIIEIYNPKLRAMSRLTLNWRHLHRVAKNLASALNALHAKGYVMGDVNQKNVLVTSNALVTLVDTDSFEIRDKAGNVYRCAVGVAEYVPPELQGVKLDSVNRLPAHDNFGLAVMIFQLLMEGFHPFTGKSRDPSLSIVGEIYLHCIKTGIFPFQDNPKFQPPPGAPKMQILHPDLQQAFVRCFVQGHRNPSARPSARNWIDLLAQAESSLVPCSKKKSHWYSSHTKACYWCEADTKRTKAQAARRTQAARAVNVPTQTPIKPWTATRTIPTATHTSTIGTGSKTLSKTAMVLGLVSLFCTGIFTAPIAAIMAIAALFKIQNDPAHYAGRGMAVTGLVSSVLAVIVSGTFMSLLSSLNSRTPNVPSSYSRPAGTNVPTRRDSVPVNAAPAVMSLGPIRTDAYSQGGEPNERFEIRILTGEVFTNRVSMRVRESSIDYNGGWLSWRDVIGQSTVTDNFGNSYSCDPNQSTDSTDRSVQAGGYREGTLVFPGEISKGVTRLTLHFSYFPGRTPIDVTTTLGNGPYSNRGNRREELLTPVPYPTQSPSHADVEQVRSQALEHVNRAQTLFAQRQYEAAIAECNRALAIDPGNTDARSLRSKINRTVRILESQ